MRFKLRSNRQQGFTLMEFLFGVVVGALAIMAVVGFSIFGSKSLAVLYASTSMDSQNRVTVDQLTKDLRSVYAITNFSTNKFICQNYDSEAITYYYNPTNKTLTRTKGATSTVLLTDCNRLTFSYGLRALSNGTFVVWPTTNSSEIKMLTAEWCCRTTVLGRTVDDQPQYVTVNIRTKQ